MTPLSVPSRNLLASTERPACSARQFALLGDRVDRKDLRCSGLIRAERFQGVGWAKNDDAVRQLGRPRRPTLTQRARHGVRIPDETVDDAVGLGVPGEPGRPAASHLTAHHASDDEHCQGSDGKLRQQVRIWHQDVGREKRDKREPPDGMVGYPFKSALRGSWWCLRRHAPVLLHGLWINTGRKPIQMRPRSDIQVMPRSLGACFFSDGDWDFSKGNR